MLHIVKQFMTGLTLILKSEFAEVSSGNTESEVSQPQTDTEIQITSVVKKSPEATEIKTKATNALSQLSQETRFNEKLIDLDIGDLSNISSILSTGATIDKSSPGYDKKGAQSLLVFLGYDISFTNKSGTKIMGEDAIDGILGGTYKKVMKELQSDLGVNITGELDLQTQNKLQALTNHAINMYQAKQSKNIKTESAEQNSSPKVNTEIRTDDNITNGIETLDVETKDILTQEIITEKKGINYESLLKIISSMTFDQLKDLQQFFVENNRKSEWSKMRKLNYIPDGIFGMFGNFEMNKIITLVDSVVLNQDTFNQSNDFNERLKIIFDYNADGLLDSKANFYTEEKEMFEAVKNETQFENILKNLGYTDKAQFDAEFSDNYLAAREKFKTQLARSLGGDYVIDPIYMMNDPEAKAKLNERLQTISDEVEEALSLNEKVQFLSETYPQLAEQFREKALERSRVAYLQSIAGVVGLASGAAASFDVSDFTKSIVDTVGIGAVNGVFGLQIGKELYQSDSGKTRVGVGLVNFYPYIAGSQNIHQKDIAELQELFQPIAKNGSKLNLSGALNFTGVVGGIDYTKIDETTKDGIEQMREQMSDLLEKVFDNIEENKDFSDLKLADNSQNKQAYEQMKALYKATGENKIAKQDIISGSLNNYERELFRNTLGLNITGVSLGITNITQYLPILGIHGEHKSQNWEERRFVITDPEGSQEVSGQNFSTIKEMETLNQTLTQYESGFSWKTRWNTGAKAFLSPTNTISERWAGLLQLSTAPKALREVNLNKFLQSKSDSSNAEKLVIISTLAGWTRKSNDVKEAKTPADLIKLDRSRRKGFNKNFGFNTDKYAEAYYTELVKTSKISEVIQQGTAFDAVSTLRVEGKEVIKGVDILHANLSMIADNDGNAIQVEVTDPSDIEAFAKNIESLSQTHGTGLSKLAQGIREGNIKLMFFKDPDGFDDRIVPVFTQSRTVAVYNPVNTVRNWALFGIKDGGNDKKTRGDNTDTTPTTGNKGDTVNPDNTGTGGGGFGGNGETIVPEVRIGNTNSGIAESSATLVHGIESRK